MIYQIDSFTDKPFAGNPAGVCVMEEAAPEPWMRDIAAEMNLSETAFLYPGDDGYNLRWFTPTVEVDLCGHATLASAHILWERGILGRTDMARFHTKSGLLTAEWQDGWIKMDFPSTPPRSHRPPEGLLEALGVTALFVGRNQSDYLVEVESEVIVRKTAPDFTALLKTEARGVMVTAKSSGDQYDFVSRFFAPAYGINEDPVTGSAHCCLGPYWKDRLAKAELSAFQASKRGGSLRVRIEGDRVHLFGQAVTIFDLRLR